MAGKSTAESPEAAPETAAAVEATAEAAPEAPKAPEAADSAPEAPSGTAYLDHDDPNASASYMGAEIVRDAEGLFLVPVHAIEALVAHGFRLIRGAL